MASSASSVCPSLLALPLYYSLSSLSLSLSPSLSQCQHRTVTQGKALECGHRPWAGWRWPSQQRRGGGGEMRGHRCAMGEGGKGGMRSEGDRREGVEKRLRVISVRRRISAVTDAPAGSRVAQETGAVSFPGPRRSVLENQDAETNRSNHLETSRVQTNAKGVYVCFHFQEVYRFFSFYYLAFP